MGQCRIDDAHFHRNAVDCREGQADDEVEGADAARYRYGEAETSDKRQEEGVYNVKTFEEGGRPHSGGGHEPVHAPDEGGVGEEKPFALHAQAA